MIGFDNGLLGGLVNGDAFNSTFNKPSQTLIGTIVSIYNGRLSVYKDAHGRGYIYQARLKQSDASSAPSQLPS